MRLPLVLLLLSAPLLTATPAQASFSGSNGQVSWIASGGALMVDDPWDDQPARKYADASRGGSEKPLDPKSAPTWSPDGTELLYTETIKAELPLPDRSAVWRINADGTGRTRVSHPYETLPDTCEGQCDNGEVTFDHAPVWSPEGDVAWVRAVYAGDEAPHASEKGTNVYVNGTRFSHFHPKSEGLVQSIVWPDGWDEPVALVINAGGSSIVTAKTKKVLASSGTSAGINDVDASPLGDKLVYTMTGQAGYSVTVIHKTGAVLHRFDLPVTSQPWVRWTPDGNGVLVPGCAKDRKDVQHCGFITHRLPDPTGDVKDTDPLDKPFLDLNIGQVGGIDMPGQRSRFDIQGQDLPIIYAPGFLGSEILCNGEKVWMPSSPPLSFANLYMQPDGKSNAACGSAATNGKPVERFLGQDVYGHAEKWLKAIDPDGGYKVFGWDWRKDPQSSFGQLDKTIDELLKQPLLVAQGTTRVSTVGHSYGGLLLRAYIDDAARAKKVARLLSVGSPFNGSAKPIFSAAFGVELPDFSVLDAMMGNDDLHEMVRNLSGAYHLYPSDNYGPWLKVDGTQLDQAGVAAFVFGVGGTPGLLNAALKNHRDSIDGFLDHDGRIDVRAVTGLGLMTPSKVDLKKNSSSNYDVTVHYENGDVTVPGRSATQGPIGTTDPLGDDINIQYQCNFAHMDQTKDAVLQTAYADYLRDGTTPRDMSRPDCKAKGKELAVYGDMDVPPPAPIVSRAARSGAAPMGISDAELVGRATVMKLPDATRIVTSEANEVPLSFTATGATIVVTPLEGDAAGTPLRYGPVTGDVVVGEGGTPEITVDGQPVQGVPVDPEVTPAPDASPAPAATATPQPVVPRTPRLSAPKSARRGKRVTIAGRDWPACARTVALSLKRGKRSVSLGKAAVTGGAFAKRVKLRRRGRYTLVAKAPCASASVKLRVR